MSCIDAACYRKKYPTVFLLLKSGISSAKIRERHQHFKVTYPKDPISLVDEKIEQIMDYFDKYLPQVETFHLVRELQTSKPTVVPRQEDLKRHSSTLKGLISKHYENILANAVAAN